MADFLKHLLVTFLLVVGWWIGGGIASHWIELTDIHFFFGIGLIAIYFLAVMLPLAKRGFDELERRREEREGIRAHAELIRCKQLFDIGILNQEEYSSKVEALKRHIV